ncbi:hypothetical protein Tco_0378318 [Tanacetum coccineum]
MCTQITMWYHHQELTSPEQTAPEIFTQLALMGYATDSDKLTLSEGAFSPNEVFLFISYITVLSPNKTVLGAVDSSNIAELCLVTNEENHQKGFSGQEIGALEADLTRQSKPQFCYTLSICLIVKKLEAQLKSYKKRKDSSLKKQAPRLNFHTRNTAKMKKFPPVSTLKYTLVTGDCNTMVMNRKKKKRLWMKLRAAKIGNTIVLTVDLHDTIKSSEVITERNSTTGSIRE